jgi:hypothetical protein
MAGGGSPPRFCPSRLVTAVEAIKSNSSPHVIAYDPSDDGRGQDLRQHDRDRMARWIVDIERYAITVMGFKVCRNRWVAIGPVAPS